MKKSRGVVPCIPESGPSKVKTILIIGVNLIMSMLDTDAFRSGFEKR